MIEERCGYISITGFPNSGKSTLINTLLKKKISIISSKVQTTKDEILGILNVNKTQFIFLDTPGIITNRKYYNKSMSREIFKSIDRVSCNLFVFDSSKEINKEQENIINKTIIKFKKNLLIINKIDLVANEKLLTISKKLNEIFNFNQTFMISAKKKKGITKIAPILENYIPHKKWIFPKNQHTNVSLKFQVSEITREKIFQLLNKELPYSMKIETSINSQENIVKINQNIIINKESQKAIFIGKK